MNKMKKSYIAVLTIALAFMVAACSGGQGTNPNSNSIATEDNVTITHVEDRMLIQTAYGEIAYPYAFSDVIKVNTKKINAVTEYIFVLVTDDFSEELYTVSFGEGKGVLIGKTSENVEVYMEAYLTEKPLSEDTETTFYAAQETINDVIASIYTWEDFIPAE